MISDVISEAMHEIEQYKETFPDVYARVTPVLRDPLTELDTPPTLSEPTAAS